MTVSKVTLIHRVRKTFCVQVVIITAHSHRDLYYLVFLSCWLFLAQEHNLETTSKQMWHGFVFACVLVSLSCVCGCVWTHAPQWTMCGNWFSSSSTRIHKHPYSVNHLTSSKRFFEIYVWLQLMKYFFFINLNHVKQCP